MRNGFTTGSCAAAAAKAAVYMLHTGRLLETISIMTPAGIRYEASLVDARINKENVSCAVRKDAGDDSDITDGILVYASAKRQVGNPGSSKEVIIEGGEGIGRVTREGLDQPVGSYAINSVPRQMIEKEVLQVMELFDDDSSIIITLSVPEGEEIAKKTFNPRLGIEGGISIIGTSGIVEPMSVRALLDTIHLELNQRRLMGTEHILIAPGNYGMDFIKNELCLDLDQAVKCSNYIGDTIDMAVECGFKSLLLIGHVGKLIKLSGGIMNTHSKEADCRMELMALAALFSGADIETSSRILDCISTDEAYAILLEKGLAKDSMSYVTEKISHYLKLRAGEKLEIGCIFFSNKYGILGQTDNADRILNNIKKTEKYK